jgi:hypothetical protein
LIQSHLSGCLEKTNVFKTGFDREYGHLLKSTGPDGAYEILKRNSAPASRPGLKRFLESILRRNSGESFSECEQACPIARVARPVSISKQA